MARSVVGLFNKIILLNVKNGLIINWLLFKRGWCKYESVKLSVYTVLKIIRRVLNGRDIRLIIDLIFDSSLKVVVDTF